MDDKTEGLTRISGIPQFGPYKLNFQVSELNWESLPDDKSYMKVGGGGV